MGGGVTINPLGIIAGKGDLVRETIEACQKQSRPFFILGVEGQTDKALVEGHPQGWIDIGEVGKALSFFKDNHVREMVMVGRFRRPSLTEIRPDWQGAQWMTRLMGRVLGDDSLLRAVIQLFEEEGVKVVSPESIIGATLLMPKGAVGKVPPSSLHLEDIARGRDLLKTLSPHDVGQAVVIQQGIVLGIEAIEGTNDLIRRCGALKRQGSAPVLIKMCKRGQETRVDRPVVGPTTLEYALEAGFAGIALEAEGVIALSLARMIEHADEKGLFILGIEA